MKVKEALENLRILVEAGRGELELIYSDSRSGDTGSVSIYNTVDKKTDHDNMGRLCDVENGYEYVPVCLDH